jgi:hypothetical protein
VQAEVLAKAAENLYKYSRVSYHGEKQKTEAAKQ